MCDLFLVGFYDARVNLAAEFFISIFFLTPGCIISKGRQTPLKQLSAKKI